MRFVNRGTVVEAYMTKEGRKHTAGAIVSPEEAATLAKAHDLIASAEYVFSSGHDAHRVKSNKIASTTTWDYFEAVAKVGKNSMPVRFMLRDVATDTREQIYKIGVNEEGVPHNNRVPKTGRLVDQGTPSEQSITEVLQNSKGQFQMWDSDKSPKSLREEFAEDVQRWYDETKPEQRAVAPGHFLIGRTSEALKSIGARTDNIYWRKYKIGTILEDHPAIDLETIKKVPEILENPILIMKSLTKPDSIVLFGDVKATNGNSVMAALELTPCPEAILRQSSAL